MDRSTATGFHQQVLNLLTENERLTQQVQHLQHQLDLVHQVGAALSPELATSWLPGLEACDGWKQLKVGGSLCRWDQAAGRADGTGLKALILDLRARPATAFDRASWDAAEQRRAQKGGGIPARPAPDRVQPQLVTSWLLNERQPGLGDALDKLTAGLRGRLRLAIEAAFLLWGDRAVAMLSTDPAGVVKALLAEVNRVEEPVIAENFRRITDLIAGGKARANARQVLGVDVLATSEEIKDRYRELAKQHHPDAGGDADQFARVSAAYEVLTTA